MALYYIGFFVEEYARVRAGEKRRAKSVVVGVAGGNGLIAVLGAMTALWGLPWIALITTGISGLLTVVAAWDGLVKHRELWVRRTVACSHLAEIERIYRMRAINCKDKDELADEAMTALNTILGDDVAAWTELRNTRELPKFDSEEVAGEHAERAVSGAGAMVGS